MILEVQQLMHEYTTWLREKTTLRQIAQSVEITTPFIDRHNDYIQIYAQKTEGGYLLTDDGYTINDLELSGCKLHTPKRQELLTMTLNGFGVQNTNNSLQIITSPENFALQKHNLIQAILAINDLFYLAEPMVTSLFYEDVVAWLDLHDVRYTPNVKFTGKSGYDHMFDFVIPKSRRQPERILRTINRPSRDSAEAAAFSWIDTREVRSSESKAYVILNDSEHTVSSNVTEALLKYSLRPIIWSMREDVQQELAA